MQFPKIPDSQEIAAMVSQSLDPMLDLLTEIRDLLQENNRLQRELGPQILTHNITNSKDSDT